MTRRIALLLALFSMLGCTLWAADDPSLGTWKLNLAKSSYSPGPAPKSQIVKYEAWEGGFKVTIDTVTANGTAAHSEFAAKPDGKEYPWTGNPNADTATVKRINERHEESVWKKNGKVTITIENVISADGKTRTVTHTGKDAQGRTVHNVQFYDKQ
jgi:hypothetical protein